jgi:hypothetical protein
MQARYLSSACIVCRTELFAIDSFDRSEVKLGGVVFVVLIAGNGDIVGLEQRRFNDLVRGRSPDLADRARHPVIVIDDDGSQMKMLHP